MQKINPRSLALRRKRLGYEQKQIAVLLGHKTISQICRYENGQRLPDLEAAFKLSIMYGLPIHVLFDRYFRQCKKELEMRLKDSGLPTKADLDNAQDYCSYLEAINSIHIDGRTTDKIRHHIKVLVEERSNRISGN